jgi:septum formation protein
MEKIRPIILASASPRRQQLLEWAEVPFEVIVKHTDETLPEGIPVEDAAIEVARTKAYAVRHSIARGEYHSSVYEMNLPLVAADTIVVLDNRIIGKPETRDQAVDFLTALSGKTHRVITGVFIMYLDEEIAFADKTEVTFYELTREQIEFYVDKYKPYDKAGAYAIQEWIGVIGIKSIIGDFYNVMGLPVSRVVTALMGLKK